MLDMGLDNRLRHFRIDLERLGATVDLVLATTQKAYPTFDVPFHSRWRHFVLGEVDRWDALAAATAWRDERARARAEFDLALYTDKPYVAFQARIEQIREKIMTMLREIKSEGKTVHIYGASTKGNTLLQWCGIDRSVVDYAADRNVEKHGAFTLGTNIGIISEEASRALKPDYYLVLPWHFRAEFLERERATIEAGTRMIFPLPEPVVIGAQDLRPSS